MPSINVENRKIIHKRQITSWLWQEISALINEFLWNYNKRFRNVSCSEKPQSHEFGRHDITRGQWKSLLLKLGNTFLKFWVNVNNFFSLGKFRENVHEIILKIWSSSYDDTIILQNHHPTFLNFQSGYRFHIEHTSTCSSANVIPCITLLKVSNDQRSIDLLAPPIWQLTSLLSPADDWLWVISSAAIQPHSRA